GEPEPQHRQRPRLRHPTEDQRPTLIDAAEPDADLNGPAPHGIASRRGPGSEVRNLVVKQPGAGSDGQRDRTTSIAVREIERKPYSQVRMIEFQVALGPVLAHP